MAFLNVSTAVNNVTFNQSLEENLADWIPVPLKRLTPVGYDIAAAILTIICIFGTFNNFCVIIIILRDQALRTPLNLMLLNLSASDLILGIYGAPLSAVAAFNRGWYFGRTVCIADSFTIYIAGVASIASLAVISVERYLLITRPGAFILTQTKALLAIGGVWVFSFVIVFPPVVGWNRYMMENPGIACSVDWETVTSNNVSYILYMFFFVLVLPLAIITFCYIKIIHTLQQQSITAAGGSVAKSQRKVTVMVAAMIVAFLIAWLPYTIVSLIVLFGRDDIITATAAAAPAILAKSSIIYNPVIYVLTNPPFRQSFIALITCGRGHISTWSEIRGRQVAPRSSGLDNLKTGNASYRPSSNVGSNRVAGANSLTTSDNAKRPPVHTSGSEVGFQSCQPLNPSINL